MENGGRAGRSWSRSKLGTGQGLRQDDGGFTRFALHLPDSARGRAEAGEVARRHNPLQRIMEWRARAVTRPVVSRLTVRGLHQQVPQVEGRRLRGSGEHGSRGPSRA